MAEDRITLTPGQRDTIRRSRERSLARDGYHHRPSTSHYLFSIAAVLAAVILVAWMAYGMGRQALLNEQADCTALDDRHVTVHEDATWTCDLTPQPVRRPANGLSGD